MRPPPHPCSEGGRRRKRCQEVHRGKAGALAIFEAFRMRRDPNMAGVLGTPVVGADQHWIDEAEFGDRGGDLRDLVLTRRPRMAKLGGQPLDRPVLDGEIHVRFRLDQFLRYIPRSSVLDCRSQTMSLPSYAMGQQSFPEMYERWLVGPLFKPWAEMTFDQLALSPRDRVLDIACGTGIVARVASERLGDAGYVVGVDVSPDMLAVARSVAPGIDWREGNANALPLRDGEQFDVVVCPPGLQFFSDKAAAARQMRRALATGGRLAVATWRSDEEIPFFRELRTVAERHLGPIADPRYSFGDAAALEALLRDAGFEDVQSSTLSRTIRFED